MARKPAISAQLPRLLGGQRNDRPPAGGRVEDDQVGGVGIEEGDLVVEELRRLGKGVDPGSASRIGKLVARPVSADGGGFRERDRRAAVGLKGKRELVFERDEA